MATSLEAEQEIKHVQIAKVFTTVPNKATDGFDELMEKYTLCKTLCICAWILRFAQNSRNRANHRETTPLKTKELESVETWSITRAQREAEKSEGFEMVKRELNLQENEAKVLKCRGRIEGGYPVYLPRNHIFTSRVIG